MVNMFSTMSIISYLPIVLLIWFPILAYYWALYMATYWKRKGVPHIPAYPFIGNLKETMMNERSPSEHFQAMYLDKKTADSPYVGINIFHKPALMIRDPELIKRILVKDFNMFCNRHSSSHNSDPVGCNNLFFIRDKAWKQMRARLTPTFTSGKMKQMFTLLEEVCVHLDRELRSKSTTAVTEIKELCARFTTDVIGTCIFGVNANSLENPECEFRRNGRKIFEVNWYRSIEFMSFWFLPEIVPIFKFKIFTEESSIFMRESINYIMEERERTGAKRNDLIDTLVTLKNEDSNKKPNYSDVVFEGDTLIAQAALFFVAGFESSSSLMSFTLFELAWQPNLQARLRQEIKEMLQKNNGKLTYDVIQNMEYLHMVVSETLRMYPTLPFLDRIVTLPENEKGYSLDSFGDVIIPNGTPIIIPVFAIHRDSKYYPNPLKFDPERFSNENKSSINPYTYLPFGTGPRSCIADRFALMQTKSGLIYFFMNHRVEPTANTPRVVELEKKALIVQAAQNLMLNVIRDPLV